MSNQQLIKSAHVWFLAALLLCGLVAVVGQAGIRSQEQQNSNQNSNSNSNSNSNRNSNSNSNTANANSSQNRNANRNENGNRNSNTRATGDQAGMAGGMSSRDRNFLMDAAMSGLMEVELGRIAAQQGASDAVKQFGQKMVDHHSQANTELMSLASSKGITLPTALDDKHREHVTKLSAMSGAEFDRAFAKMMLRDHEKAVSDFEKQSNRGGDADVKAFASKALPTLQEHLTMARALPGNERGGNSNSGGGSRNSNRNSNSNNNGNGNSNRP